MIHIEIQIIMNCAEFQIIWMKGLIHRPTGTAVGTHRFGTNGLTCDHVVVAILVRKQGLLKIEF